jgi:hypothetical protein
VVTPAPTPPPPAPTPAPAPAPKAQVKAKTVSAPAKAAPKAVKAKPVAQTYVARTLPVAGVQAGAGGTAPGDSNGLLLGLAGGTLVLLASGGSLIAVGRRNGR